MFCIEKNHSSNPGRKSQHGWIVIKVKDICQKQKITPDAYDYGT